MEAEVALVALLSLLPGPPTSAPMPVHAPASSAWHAAALRLAAGADAKDERAGAPRAPAAERTIGAASHHGP
jgi:hypothetical protein